MSDLRPDFERLNRDSLGFRRSRKGTYTNPLIARDWKWFELGAIAESRAAALSAAPQSDGWRPIAEAPKDGRTLLLGHFNKAGKWRTMRGQWMSEEYIAEQWEEPENGEAGWFETSAEADDTPNCWATEPTHFMSLPTPPNQAQGSKA